MTRVSSNGYIYFLSLGSNLGKRLQFLKNAVFLLQEAGIRISKSSSVYETHPTDLKSQPNFLNQVVKIWTRLAPVGLLRTVKKIEKECGRKKTVRFGPRTLDIDILWWNGGCVKRKNLMIPHPRAAQRKFVLVPWAEIAGKNFMLQGKTLKDWIKKIDRGVKKQKVRKLRTDDKLLKA